MTRNTGTAKPQGVKRIFFQEILEGDRRKLEGRSNDAASGGGARDLRFPNTEFGQLFRELLPGTKAVKRTRNQTQVEIEVNVGDVYWFDPVTNNEVTAEVTYESPTDARPREGRIPRIHDISYLAHRVPPAHEGPVYLLLVQQDSGKVYPHYITARMLNDPLFNQDVAATIRQCAVSTPDHRSTRGYIDYSAQKRYCHG